MLENTVSFTGQRRDADAHRLIECWRELPTHNYVKMLVIGALFCFLYRAEIESIVSRWITDSSWSHGFLIPLFSLYFIDQHKNEILSLETRPNYLGLVFLICGVLFYPFNVVHLQYGYLSPLGMIASLGAIVLFLGGWRLIRHTWLPICFLVFAIPLPQRYYNSLTIPMRRWAATVASGLLNLVPDLETTANGVLIDVFYKGQALEPALDVAEACSGMRLLLAFLALGVAMAYLHERPLWQRLVLLASTAPIAILCNIVRVTITGFVYILIHPRYAQGIYHDMLGMAMLPLAFGLYGLLAFFMSNLFVYEAQRPVEDVIIRTRYN
ncbi:MAG: exosortase/archaeosortase family protein [Phycisphaerales bacterium]|nr:MAG: exosortase/archaeosortase family protein [Phycisphaerales bacterium]